MENEMKSAAIAIAQRFLLTNLYVEKFYGDAGARQFMPLALQAVTKRDAEQALTHPDPRAAELLAAVHEDVEQFFADVELRLKEIDANMTARAVGD